MASIYKKPGAAKYTISYFDENGDRRTKIGTRDKAVTQRLANELENQVALRKAGLVDPKAEGYRDHEARSLADHLADWRAVLVNQGSTPKHANQTVDRVRRLVAVVF